MKSTKKFGLVAMGQVQQVLPASSATITAVSNRVGILEGINASSRILALENQIAALLSHTHDYQDDDGTIEVTKTTSSN